MITFSEDRQIIIITPMDAGYLVPRTAMFPPVAAAVHANRRTPRDNFSQDRQVILITPMDARYLGATYANVLP